MSEPRLAVWPPLPPRVLIGKDLGYRPFPLDHEAHRCYSLARHALWHGCRALGLGPGDEVLAPAYHHGSEIEALLRVGLRPRFYEATETLEPNPDELEGLLRPTVRALHLIHYLGLPQDAARWRAWCDARGLLLIEDAAQAFLASLRGSPVGSFGDLAIFCIYKTFGVPDGAVMISRSPPPRPRSKPKVGAYGLIKRQAAWLAQRSRLAAAAHSQVAALATSLEGWRGEDPQKEFDLGDPSTPPSRATSQLLSRVMNPIAADRRRFNYGFLLERLGVRVPPPFASLPEGASPFAFPVEADEPETFIEQLHRRGIKCDRFWLHPHPSLPVEDFPRARALRERLVALPVHQELRSADLQRIADVVTVVGS